MDFESFSNTSTDDKEDMSMKKQEIDPKDRAEKESSSSADHGHMLGIEMPTVYEYKHLIKVQQDQIDDIDRSWVKQGLTPRQVTEAKKPIQEVIDMYKSKARKEVNHLIRVEEETIKSLKLNVQDEETKKLIRRREMNKILLKKDLAYFS